MRQFAWRRANQGSRGSFRESTNLNVCRTGIEEEEEKVASLVDGGGWAIRAEAGLLRWEAGHNTVDSLELTRHDPARPAAAYEPGERLSNLLENGNWMTLKTSLYVLYTSRLMKILPFRDHITACCRLRGMPNTAPKHPAPAVPKRRALRSTSHDACPILDNASFQVTKVCPRSVSIFVAQCAAVLGRVSRAFQRPCSSILLAS